MHRRPQKWCGGELGMKLDRWYVVTIEYGLVLILTQRQNMSDVGV